MNLPNYMCVLCFFDEAEKGEISSGIIVAIVVSIFVAVMIFIATIRYFCKRTKKKYDFECKNCYIVHKTFSFVKLILSFFFLLLSSYSHAPFCCVAQIDIDINIGNLHSLQYDFSIIEAATNNFSADNKLSEFE